METESHTPRVAGLMRSIRLRQLRNITLANVLANDTSPPISLSNFEAYMTFSENSLQELQFIVWFQDYAARFFALADDVQRRSPGPPVEVFEHKCRFLRGLLARLRRKSADSTVLSPTYSEKSFHTSAEKVAAARHLSCQYSRMRAMSDASESTAVGSDIACVNGTCLCQQPFREESLHVAHTFFRPDSPKSLKIDKVMRQAVAIRLGQSTHPDVFADVYEFIYNRIERVSLPQFIVLASTNMSTKKQLLWYFIGFFSLLTSLAIALTTILVIPARHPSTRGYRTFAIPFWTFACISLYASITGICPYMVYSEPRQLRAWELGEADGKTRNCLAAAAAAGYPPGSAPQLPPIASSPPIITIPAPAITVAHPQVFTHASTASITTVGSSFVRAPGLESQQTIHGALDRDPAPEVPAISHETIPDANFSGGRLRNGFRRPPIFGPNIITLDARIHRVHVHTLRTSFLMSFTCTMLFSIVLYSVPSIRH